jgi:SWI/SNF-related matrix-associated actin-dependent regulator of chromatin subfamily B protein 1
MAAAILVALKRSQVMRILHFAYRTAIAHQIREQVQHVSKSLMQSGHAYDGSPVEDEEISEILLPAVKSVPKGTRRDEKARSSYGPTVIDLLPEEVERLDKESFRDPKRKKRGRARRVTAPTPAVPERETPLTMRTGVVQRVNAGISVTARTSAGNRGSQSAPAGGGEAGNGRGRRAAAVAAATATAAMLAADRAADRAEREEDREVDEDEEDGVGDGDDFDGSDDEENPGSRLRFAPRHALPPRRKFLLGLFCCMLRLTLTPLPAPAPTGYQSLPGVRSAPIPHMRPQGGGPNPPVPRQPHNGDHVLQLGEAVPEWDLPHWLQSEMARVRQAFPTDFFTIAKRPRTAQDTFDTPRESFLRIRCHDCPGRQYALGPGLSLHNFEVHLNNRQHRAAVNSRS